MKSDKTAIDTYKYFSNLEGNQHIASEFALKTILKIIYKYRPEKILEVGLGIGSISYCILDFCKISKQNISYFGTEMNQFCLDVLSKYLKEYYLKVNIFNSLKDISLKDKFDLIIIDGSDDYIKATHNMLSEHGIIIIEGDRLPQLEIIRTIFPKSLHTSVISNYKNPNYGPFLPKDYSGGLQLIFVNPDLKQKLDYCKFKIQTAFCYRLRDFKE